MEDSTTPNSKPPGPPGPMDARARAAPTGTDPRSSIRQPIRTPVPTLGEQWVVDKQRQGHAGARDNPAGYHLACLVVAHEPEFEEGVIEATHTEMAEFAKDKQALSFQIRGDGCSTYLLAEAGSAYGVAEGIDEARLCSENIILDKIANMSAVFVESPLLGDSEVQLEHLQESGRTRLRMLDSTQILSPTTLQALGQQSSYKDSICCQLATALRKVGRVRDSMNLRIHLGRFSLLSYPESVTSGGRPNTLCGLDQLCRLLQHHRTISELQTQVGDLGEAMRILAALKKDDSPFLSEDMSSFSSAAVRPEYVFEAQSSNHRFEAPLRQLSQPGAGKYTGWKVSHVQAYDMAQRCSSGVQLDFKTLSLDDTLDWMIETVHEVPIEAGYEGFKSEMRAATVRFDRGQGQKDDDYPRIHFTSAHKLSSSLENVAIKNVFRFRYSMAPYKLEFAIRREWDNMLAMQNTEKQPVTTYSVTIYGENWGEARACEIAGTDRGWGRELENLFHNDGKPESQGLSGQERVGALVEAIQAIRHALTPRA